MILFIYFFRNRFYLLLLAHKFLHCLGFIIIFIDFETIRNCVEVLWFARLTNAFDLLIIEFFAADTPSLVTLKRIKKFAQLADIHADQFPRFFIMLITLDFEINFGLNEYLCVVVDFADSPDTMLDISVVYIFKLWVHVLVRR